MLFIFLSLTCKVDYDFNACFCSSLQIPCLYKFTLPLYSAKNIIIGSYIHCTTSLSLPSQALFPAPMMCCNCMQRNIRRLGQLIMSLGVAIAAP